MSVQELTSSQNFLSNLENPICLFILNEKLN
jgi:hypothetical protein